MSPALVTAITATALFDLGIAYAVYRVYRWASTPAASGTRSGRQPAAHTLPRHQAAASMTDLA